MVDFSKKLPSRIPERLLDPAAIYDALDRASDKGPLRPAQAAVLADWHKELRASKDVILKMHTGQGKTLVGLLILQSKLNETGRPALYLCPDRYLVSQTSEQARQFGISTVTGDEIPVEFLDGKAILVTTVQKLFNGLTKFRLGPQAQEVNAIVVDDAHASVDRIRDAFRVRVPRDHAVYSGLLSVFIEDLKRQGPGSLAGIEDGDLDEFLCVPYWAWQARQDDVLRVLSENRDDNAVKFAWPLLKDSLSHCQCVISGASLEIEPYLAPLELFRSFHNAGHRVFMSATTADDSFLLKGLRVAAKSIRHPLIYRDERWSGEKMILLPSLVDPALDRSAIVNFLGRPVEKRTFGVVALAPSLRGTADWSAVGARIATKETLESDVKRLKDGDCSQCLVLVNRYDGIDLPDRACRVLIFDSRPYADSLVDRYADKCRPGSDVTTLRTAKRIEQGLGRSVRGEKDFSVIVMIGGGLITSVRGKHDRRYLSAQTQGQIEIGLEVAAMAKEEIQAGADPMNALIGLVNQCLKRDPAWKKYYTEKMDALRPGPTEPAVLDLLERELLAEQHFLAGRIDDAVQSLQRLTDGLPAGSEKGWYLQELARYTLAVSKVNANRLQLAAYQANRGLLAPPDGIKFVRLGPVSTKRVDAVRAWLAKFDSPEQMTIRVEECLGDMAFGVPANRFEAALHEVGAALGFAVQRPDDELKEGPDNLWALKDRCYLFAECKSDVDEARIEVARKEAGQMNTHCAWFEEKYPGCSVTRLLVHPGRKLAKGAHFTHDVALLRKKGLREFVRTVRAFAAEFKGLDLADLSERKVQEILEAHDLAGEDFMSRFTTNVASASEGE